MNALKIYKSSAGSGKTFILVKEYLRLVLKNPEDYQHILAITFTNKAAAEMKERIVKALVDLSKGKVSPLKSLLTSEIPELNLQKQAAKVLKLILHNYSAFSVSTIDSFFQRILRALAREMQLPLRLEVQVSLDDAITEVTDQLLRDAGKDKELTEWLSDLLIQKLDEDKGWNIEQDIEIVARELFKDHYDEKQALSRDKIKSIYNQLYSIRKDFESRMKEPAQKAFSLMQNTGLNVESFSYGKSGVMGNILKIGHATSPDDYRIGKRAEAALLDPDKWYAKSSKDKQQIIHAVESGLGACLEQLNDIFTNGFRKYLSACEALRRIYMFGIANDILKKLSQYRNENNVILLADTPKMLSEIITGQDAPFIYEKAGNRYKHLLIDEFQDTSVYQWKNLLPLIENTLGSGHMALVVGDVKQSIYRWRGGNMQLLIKNIFEDLQQFRELYKAEILSTNYRSRKDVVEFNNDFFELIPELVRLTIHEDSHFMLDHAYSDELLQLVSSQNEKDGYVRIEFLEKNNSPEDDEESEGTGWKQKALKKTAEKILVLLSNGYDFRDIAILVRKNSEGNEIAQYLLNQGISNIISPDSLLISTAPRIRFLVNLMRFLSNPEDPIASSDILYYYSRTILNNSESDNHKIFFDQQLKGNNKRKKETGINFESSEKENSLFKKIMPEEFTGNTAYFSKLPVHELSEHLVRIFFTGNSPDAYIQRFQDLVLEFASTQNSSLDGFIEWWNNSNTVKNCSVITPENENAIRIMTIHKAKGLQFPVVLMPFAEWRILPRANELFWAHADEEPYSEMGRVPLLSSKRLSETYFEESYHEEVMQTLIDNLNLLYVAFTRAEEQLFVYTPVNTSSNINSVSGLMQKSLDLMNCPLEDNIYRRGNDKLNKNDNGNNNPVKFDKLRIYLNTKWQDKIRVSSKAVDILQMTGAAAGDKINYGVLIHRVLAGIKTLDDLEQSIDKILFEGLISEENRIALHQELENLLKLPEVRELFDSGWDVRNERDIILPGGEILRPDRVISRNEKTYVIDFKTGKESSEHKKQIQKYADVLRKMHYSNVQCFLVYIAGQKVVEVLPEAS